MQAWNSPNGAQNGDSKNGVDPADVTDDGDMADSETEDLDDDMLDKISSSPSIDDGRYSLLSSALPASAWPTRSTSLCVFPLPTTPPQQHVYQHRNVSPESDQASSSPFTITPQHLPLSYQPQHQSTPPSFSTPLAYSPFSTPPLRLPAHRFARQERPSSADHHRVGEYPRTGLATSYIKLQEQFDDNFDDDLEDCHEEDYDYVEELQDDVGPLLSEQYERQFYEHEFGGGPEGGALVFPPNRPLPPIPVSDSTNDLTDVFGLSRCSTDPMEDAEVKSWETDSNASSFDLEEETAMDNDDDDPKDILFSLDQDRHDSAYGGECLRETEDIDFEFVYALHTFVATVEGQANATKGDTMVLLDDSNSYWWLVRVVKDSSIGRDFTRIQKDFADQILRRVSSRGTY